MPIVIRQADGGLGVIVTASGAVSEREYLDFYEAQLTAPAAAVLAHRYCLTDYTAVESVDISAGAIAHVAALTRKAARTALPTVTAIVASQDLIYGLTRMWQIQTSDEVPTASVFRDLAEAKAWIRHQLEVNHGIGGVTFE